VYAWVSWLQEDATWRGAENFGNVAAFARQFKAAYPESNLLGWVSFPVNVGENNYRLDNEDLQQSIADFSQLVVNDMGFDGVFLNIEPVWDGDENFLALLRKVRASIGDNTPISVAIPPDWSPIDAGIPVPPLIVPGTVWEKEYKQSVALLSDEMAVMAYNSGLSSSADYVQWVAYQIKAFSEAVSELGAGTELVIGIPTYDSELPGHDTAVENVASAVQGVLIGLREAGDRAAFVRGVAIYAGWTTDETEWSQYESTWVRR
jgi:spore germination protein YaaH